MGRMGRLPRAAACAALLAAATVVTGCSSGGKPATQRGGGGDDGGGTWDGAGDPWAGTSGALLAIRSGAIAFSPAHVLSGTVASGVTAVSVALNGGAPEPATVAGGTFTRALTLAPGLNALELVATDGAGDHAPLAAAVTYRDGAPTTAELIDAALGASTLSPAQALEYRAWAAFGDPRLPAAYRGGGRVDATNVIAQLWEAEGTLSPEAHDALGRLLIPDFYVESGRSGAAAQATAAARPALLTAPWRFCSSSSCELDPSWVSTDGPNVRVWWHQSRPDDGIDAGSVLNLIDGPGQLWTKLEALLGQRPAPDGTSGGDARLDIIITDMGGQPGATITSRFCSAPCPTFIKLQRDPSGPGYIWDAAIHELMHAFVWGGTLAAGKLQAYVSISEGTANWAANRYLPRDQWEHRYSSYWMDEPHRGLFSVKDPSTDLFTYGTWIFYAWLSNHMHDRLLGDLVISRIWANARTMTDQATIVDQAIRWVTPYTGEAETLEDVWPKFVADAWNWGNDPALFKLDLVTDRPHFSKDVVMTTAYSTTAEGTMTSPGARYYHYEFPDPKVRTILFLDGVGHRLTSEESLYSPGRVPTLYPLPPAQARGIVVQGMRREAGSPGLWTDPENWTTASPPRWWDPDGHASSVGYAFFCTEDRRVPELDVAVSYVDAAAPGKSIAPAEQRPTLTTSTAPCAYLKATAETVTAWRDEEGSSYEKTQSYEGYLDSFDLDAWDSDSGDGTMLHGVAFSGQTEKVTWRLQSYDAITGCTASGSGSVTGLNDMGPLFLQTWADPPHAGAAVWWGFSLTSNQPPEDQPYQLTCPPPEPPPPPPPPEPPPPPPPPPEPTTHYLAVDRLEPDWYWFAEPAMQEKLRFGAEGTVRIDQSDETGSSTKIDLVPAAHP